MFDLTIALRIVLEVALYRKMTTIDYANVGDLYQLTYIAYVITDAMPVLIICALHYWSFSK